MAEQLQFPDRASFREWLQANQAREEGIWLVFGKAGRTRTLSPDEALAEALCFGWIDGQIRSIDESSYMKRFTPRRQGSQWSARNRRLAAGLIADGLMTEHGLKAIERAKQGGTWEVPGAERPSEEEVAELATALAGRELALANLLAMPPSVRRTYAGHYLSAKTDDTRRRRLEQIAARLEENKRPM